MFSGLGRLFASGFISGLKNGRCDFWSYSWSLWKFSTSLLLDSVCFTSLSNNVSVFRRRSISSGGTLIIGRKVQVDFRWSSVSFCSFPSVCLLRLNKNPFLSCWLSLGWPEFESMIRLVLIICSEILLTFGVNEQICLWNSSKALVLTICFSLFLTPSFQSLSSTLLVAWEVSVYFWEVSWPYWTFWGFLFVDRLIFGRNV